MYSAEQTAAMVTKIALLKELGCTNKRIARHLKCAENTVQRHSKKGPAPGKRTRVHSDVVRRRMLVGGLADRREKVDGKWYPMYPTAHEIVDALMLKHKVKATVAVVRSDLKCEGYKSYVRKYDPTRDPKHVVVKKRFARKMLTMSPRFLKRLAFSDEHTLSLNDHTSRRMYAKNRSRVIGREKKRIVNTAHVMVWGCFGNGFKSKLVFVDRKVDEDGVTKKTMNGDWYQRHCLQPSMPGMLQHKVIFQQDGARPHVKKTVLKYLASKQLPMLKVWPPYAPDLSPIENFWAVMNFRVSKKRPRDEAELRIAATEVWDALTRKEMDKWTGSFTNLCRKYLGLPTTKRERKGAH